MTAPEPVLTRELLQQLLADSRAEKIHTLSAQFAMGTLHATCMWATEPTAADRESLRYLTEELAVWIGAERVTWEEVGVHRPGAYFLVATDAVWAQRDARDGGSPEPRPV